MKCNLAFRNRLFWTMSNNHLIYRITLLHSRISWEIATIVLQIQNLLQRIAFLNHQMFCTFSTLHTEFRSRMLWTFSRSIVLPISRFLSSFFNLKVINFSIYLFLLTFFTDLAERSSSGLIQFETIVNAIEALIICNHVSIPNPSKCNSFFVQVNCSL